MALFKVLRPILQGRSTKKKGEEVELDEKSDSTKALLRTEFIAPAGSGNKNDPADKTNQPDPSGGTPTAKGKSGK